MKQLERLIWPYLEKGEREKERRCEKKEKREKKEEEEKMSSKTIQGASMG